MGVEPPARVRLLLGGMLLAVGLGRGLGESPAVLSGGGGLSGAADVRVVSHVGWLAGAVSRGGDGIGEVLHVSFPVLGGGGRAETAEPEILSLSSAPGGGYDLVWTSSVGRVYRVEMAAALGAVVMWERVGEVTAGGVTASLVVPAEDGERFFRVVLER